MTFFSVIVLSDYQLNMDFRFQYSSERINGIRADALIKLSLKIEIIGIKYDDVNHCIVSHIVSPYRTLSISFFFPCGR